MEGPKEQPQENAPQPSSNLNHQYAGRWPESSVQQVSIDFFCFGVFNFWVNAEVSSVDLLFFNQNFLIECRSL
jgi:hypothetical protein